MNTIGSPNQPHIKEWVQILKKVVKNSKPLDGILFKLNNYGDGFNKCIEVLRDKIEWGDPVDLDTPRLIVNLEPIYDLLLGFNEIEIYYSLLNSVYNLYTTHLYNNLDLFKEYVYSERDLNFPEVSTSSYEVVGKMKIKKGFVVSYKIDENEMIINFENDEGEKFIVRYNVNLSIE